MVIDCDDCTMRDVACGDCVVTFLLDRPPGAVVFDVEEELAIRALQAGGLTPASRYAPRKPAAGA